MKKIAIAIGGVLAGFGLIFLFSGGPSVRVNPPSPPTVSATVSPRPDPKAVLDDLAKRARILTYDQMARTPDAYVGQIVALIGRIIDILEPSSGNKAAYRTNITHKTNFGYALDWTDTILVVYERPADAPRFLEGDIVGLIGEFHGLVSYTAILGNKVTLPDVSAAFMGLWPAECIGGPIAACLLQSGSATGPSR